MSNMSKKIGVKEAALLQSKIDAACNPQTANYLPGTTFVVVDREGNELFAGAGGRRGVDTMETLTTDSVYWIASCTKIITAVALMQLVEKGLIELDDADALEKHLAELAKVKVLVRENGALKLTEKKRRITLRMLTDHTAGFGYSFFSEELRDFSRPAGFDEFSGLHSDLFKQPLIYQPGERWNYGINFDWIGLLIERISGVTLEEYFREHIFKPLGINNMSFIPDESMLNRMVHLHSRAADGTLTTRDHLMHRTLAAQTPEEKKTCVNSGGGGLFGEPGEFCKVLSTLINGGTSPHTGASILKGDTVEKIFTNQIPHWPQFGRQGVAGAKRDLTLGAADFYPMPGNPPQGFSMAGMSTPTATGRPETSTFWSGMANLFFWCDRETGVAGMICAQILPYGDHSVIQLWLDLEKTVYDALKK